MNSKNSIIIVYYILYFEYIKDNFHVHNNLIDIFFYFVDS